MKFQEQTSFNVVPWQCPLHRGNTGDKEDTTIKSHVQALAHGETM